MGAIAGIRTININTDSSTESVQDMLDTMRHRAPFCIAHTVESGIVLGARYKNKNEAVAFDETNQLFVIIDGWVRAINSNDLE